MVSPSYPTPRLFYVVDWLPPDFGAIGQYASVFARELACSGRQVHLIGLTSGKSQTVSERFPSGGSLEVMRIATSAYDKTNYVRRLIWVMNSNFRLTRAVVCDSRARGSEILFTGAPPFMLYFAVIAKYILGARLIYRITDFYPEVLLAELGQRSLLLALVERLTWFTRRRVDIFQALGEDQRELLLAGGIPPGRIVLKRDFSPVPITGQETPVAPPEALCGRKILLYSGNYGVAHEVDTVVEGLIRHHRTGSDSFALWVNGSGPNADRVCERLRLGGVPVARTEPVPLDQLPSLLAAADLHLIALRSQFSGIVLPSKVYGCIASRRPILFVGPESSDVHRLCLAAPWIPYERIEPGDGTAFVAALERFLTVPGSEQLQQREVTKRR
jgi:hypothetical protein